MKPNPNWELLAKYIQGNCTSKEKSMFEEWLRLHDNNQTYFDEIKKAWDSHGSSHVSFLPDKTKGWENIVNEIEIVPRKRIYVKSRLIRIAATIALIIGLYALYNQYAKINIKQAMFTEVKNQLSKPEKIILPDSTVVWLNENTTIKYGDFKRKKRLVYLKGEAFFEVFKDPEKPFIIKTTETETKVLGTSFNIRAYSHEQHNKIAVFSGKVAFNSKRHVEEKAILTKGMSGNYDCNNSKLTISKEYDPNSIAWKTGKLLFLKTDLLKVSNMLEDHYDKEIFLLDPELEELVLTAAFNQQPFEEVIEIISRTLDINYKQYNDSIILSRY